VKKNEEGIYVRDGKRKEVVKKRKEWSDFSTAINSFLLAPSWSW
jgi:hypothetical protein